MSVNQLCKLHPVFAHAAEGRDHQMNLALLLEMVSDGMTDRVLVGDKAAGLTAAELRARAASGADLLKGDDVHTLVYLGPNGPAFPVALFSAALAGIPFLPLNFRLSDEQLDEILSRHKGSLLLSDTPARLSGASATLSIVDFMRRTVDRQAAAPEEFVDPERIAVLLLTSGTTAAPKSAVLRHENLTAYILGSVEYASADVDDAAIVSVPPYHIAAVANLLSNLYTGRRIVYLDQFDPRTWLSKVRDERITHAMVVPTMLVRIVEELERSGEAGPTSLRAISYGGAKISPHTLEKALALFPDTDFVNAYGLTETSSSIAVLGPEDHRAAVTSSDPAVRARLGSVGRPLPGVEIEIQDADGAAVPPNTPGLIMVRGPQVAGEYLEAGSTVGDTGWFSTRDLGYFDRDGFLFVNGRADDTIIRGGENVAPSEIEEVLVAHPAVSECAVVGIPDEEWGQRIAAFVVPTPGIECEPEALREFVRARLRSSKTPDEVMLLSELPTTPTGKVLRRVLVGQVSRARGPGVACPSVSGLVEGTYTRKGCAEDDFVRCRDRCDCRGGDRAARQDGRDRLRPRT